ncbi:alpha/beta fold hydrolase [Paenibacillus gyeongsangnamensis]|uniref:hypothetical protein n=1 Tax=Paenibacillus gyeongsangnamensis TaxID=3388067 RepID=UPI0022B86826|nr:hypothetical protein [Paenibacillus filicis]
MRRGLSRLTQPTLVLVSGEDEVFLPEAYAPLYAKYCKAEVEVLPGHDHDEIVSSDKALEAVRAWWWRLPF